MNSFSTKVSKDVMQKMMRFYDEFPEKKVPYAYKQNICGNFNVTFYNSGTVLFQGNNFQSELDLWNFEQKKLQTKNHIGSDEVGTGDYFGPIVVCAVFFEESLYSKIKDLKIDDSKKLTDSLILDLGPKLMAIFEFEAIILPNQKYNELNMNKNKLLAILHHKTIQKLLKKVQNTDVYIDQFVEKKGFENHLNIKVNYNFETKADGKYYAVAIASIIARYLFLKNFDDLFKNISPTPLKGASTQLDEIAKELVKKYGFEFLEKYAKISFKNTEKIMKKGENYE